MMKKKIQINVNEKIYVEFQAICKEESTNVAAEIRTMMKQAVKEHEAKEEKAQK